MSAENRNMKQYVDKSIIVEELEKKIRQYRNERNTLIKKDSDNAKDLLSRIRMCEEMISYLESLEPDPKPIECKVGWYDGFVLDFTEDQLNTSLGRAGVDYDDEVLIFIAKKE